MDTIPREPIDAEPLDLWREHRGEDLRSVGREALAGVLEETGVELGAHDARIAAWAGDWELSTVTTIASWLVRAYDAGRRAAAPDQPRPRVDVDADQPEPDQPEPYRVTLDLTEHDAYFVLTTALEEWAHDQRGQAENELADDPEDTTAASRLTWAAVADELLERVEADQPRTSPPDQLAAAVDEPDQPSPDQPPAAPNVYGPHRAAVRDGLRQDQRASRLAQLMTRRRTSPPDQPAAADRCHRCGETACGCCSGCGYAPDERCPECLGCGCADNRCPGVHQ